MALTKGDVLATLNDPMLSVMDFWVGNVHVHGTAYGRVRSFIETDDVLVVEGTDSLAYYDSATDVLTTQNSTPPGTVYDRALLLHECTHALVDLGWYHVTQRTNEIASYLAQFTYLLLSYPVWQAGRRDVWGVFFDSVITLARAYSLHTPAGRGARLAWASYQHLEAQLVQLPGDVPGGKVYGDLAPDTM